MTDIKVKPMLKGLIEINHGGIVIYKKNGHGLVVSLSDFKDNSNAFATCQDLNLNGYDDWRLPTNEEFEKIKSILGSKFSFLNNSRNFRPVRSF